MQKIQIKTIETSGSRKARALGDLEILMEAERLYKAAMGNLKIAQFREFTELLLDKAHVFMFLEDFAVAGDKLP